MKNLCENCNVCCIVFRIDKKFLSWRTTCKEAGETCDKLVNKRCARYLRRPKPCKDFKCWWLRLRDHNLNKLEWRPDKVGFMVRQVLQDDQHLIIIHELGKDFLDFKNITIEQDSFLKTIFSLKENNSIILIQPFGYKHQYPLRYTSNKI